jgi:hypothetical protein
MNRRDDMRSLIRGLAPVEVFDYYDGPRFYSCRDVVGQLYLVYWVDESEAGTSWLYLRISLERYAALKRGDVPIADALSRPEDDSVLIVRSCGQEFLVEQLTAAEIEPDWLPAPQDRLAIGHAALPTRLSSPADLAPRVRRQVFDVAFEKISNTYEMAAGKLGRLLEAFQNTIYALSCDPKLDIRRVPEETKQRSELMVTELFASSFGVRLQTKGVGLFEADDTERALLTLAELIDALSAPETLAEDLHQLNILARSRFKHLLRVLVDSQVSVKADWATPLGRARQSRASFADISLSLQKLEASDAATSRVVERSVRLVGVDVQSDFFAVVLDDGEVIKGKLSKGLASKHFEVPSLIKAKLQETSVVDPLTDREKWTYVLLDVL